MKRHCIHSVFIRLFLASILVGLCASLSWADIFMKQRTYTEGFQMRGQNVPPREDFQVSWIREDMIRHDNERQSIIIRLDKMTMTMLDHPTRTYRLISLKENAGGDDREEGKPGTRERKRAESKMPRETMKLKITITDTGEQKKIGKWKCRKYIQQMDSMMGPSRSEIWATEDLRLDTNVLSRFNAAMAMPMGSRGSMEEVTQEMKKIKGVPVLTTSTVDIQGAKMKSNMELLEFKEEQAPKGTFEVPADYTRKSM